MDYQKICDRLADEIRTAKDGKTAVTILPTADAEVTLEMLKKHIPVKPRIIKDWFGIPFLFCPVCNKELYSHGKEIMYCQFCGQAIDET